MMKKIVALAFALIAIAMPCGARADSPASRPAHGKDDVELKPEVVIDSINVIGPTGSDWVGRAIQQGVAAGISQASAKRFGSIDPQRSRPNMSLDELQRLGVQFYVTAVCQVADDQIRIDGQVGPLGTENVVGTFRLEGGLRDLFSMEDTLSDKIVKIMSTANDAKNKDASPANQPTTKPAAAETPVTLPDLGSNRFSGADVPRYFDGDLPEILTPPARFQDEANRYFNSQPVYPFAYPCYIYSPFVGSGYFGGFSGGSIGNFEPTFGPD